MIEAVILYSTNDYRFFKVCIDNLLKSGITCHIVTYSHMWNGDNEDIDLLNKSFEYYKNNPMVNLYKIEWIEGQTPWYWESMGRYLATQQLPNNSEYVLYIDIDEIVDFEYFNKWIGSEFYKKYDSLKIANYWYFREPIYQSVEIEDSVVMCKTSLAKSIPQKNGGRECYLLGNFTRNVSNDTPFIHHFSWVRSKEEMLKKVKNWGHLNESNWVDKIEDEFSRDFNGTDFINGYQYKIVENKFNL